MLEFLVWRIHKNYVYTDNPKLFCKIYKWVLGLNVFIDECDHLKGYVIGLMGVLLAFSEKFWILGAALVGIGFCLNLLYWKEINKREKYKARGLRTEAQVRNLHIEKYIRKIVTTHGKALDKKDWQKIEEEDIRLYDILTDNECNHCCYYYSLEIARIFKDSILIWGAVKDPLDKKHRFFAHAVILRNGYIYDSNMRQSERFEDFVKLYKFKEYKTWQCDEYCKLGFRKSEREGFREWCKQNNVLAYQRF